MKKNIVFYCHNFGGLGHTRRISLIINEILKNFGDFYNVVFLNSGKKQDFLFDDIEGVKIINLPNYNIENYNIISGDKVFLYRKTIYERLFSIGNIEKLVIEHYPFGRNFLNIEIKSLVKIFKKHNKQGVVFSSVRDIFEINSLNKTNLDLFDRFLIHGDKKIKNYDNIFSADIENKFLYTGYVIEKGTINRKNENFILISLGGGQDGLEYVLDFLNIFKLTKLNFEILINLGLNYNKESISKVNEIGLKNIEIKDYFENFLELKKKAKIIVSMGGYNNFIENIFYNKISIIYPRETDDEQKQRLNIFRGKFKNIIDGREIDINSLTKILLSQKQKNEKKIDFDGAYFSASFISNFKKYKYIKIRLTNACNAKCDMCGVIKRKIQTNVLGNLKNTIIDFYKLGGEVINFTGGEPTIYKGFWELLKFSKSLGLITSVSTNGSTLGDLFFKNLYFNGVKLIDYIDISLDGLNDLHDKIRSYKGLFKILDSNIYKIIENKIYLHINITIRNDNIDEMINIFNYLKEKKVNSISFGMIASDPLNDTRKLIPNIEKLEKFYKIDKNEILKNKGDIKITFSPDYSNEDFIVFAKSIQNKNAFSKKHGEKCSFIKEKKEIRINEGGNISPCCILDDFEEGLGSINTAGLLDIVCSEKYENFLNKTFPNISKACLNCKIEI